MKRTVPDSTEQSGFMKKKKKSATKQIFHQATLKQAFSSYVFFPTSAYQWERCDQFPQDWAAWGKWLLFLILSNNFSISCGLCYSQHFCKWAKQRQAALLLRELHLGTRHHLHIYWEHTFLVYNSHHSGVGAGNWGRLAGILSPVMRPLSMNIPGRRKQVIITVLGLNWCCSLPSHIVLNQKRKK